MNSMNILACTGDSHTWGQGAEGVKAVYTAWQPPVVGGEHRQLPFSCRTYVSRLRELVNAKTGSWAQDFDAKTLGAALGCPAAENCVAADSLTLPFRGALVRLQFRLRAEASHAAVFIDGEPLWESSLFSTDHAELANPYNLVTLRVPDGEHTLGVRGSGALLYRVECYGGSWAVVNCGVGSCPVGRYLERYYDACVAPLSPAIVLAEGHTVNDWLTGETPAEYEALLRAYFARVRADGAKAALLTVEPILGRQVSGAGFPFEAYVAASRHAAEALDISIADAHAALADTLRALVSAYPVSRVNEAFADIKAGKNIKTLLVNG